MNIQYISDLHLDVPINSKFIRANPILPKAPILLLAGDIIGLAHLDKVNFFWDYVSAAFEQTIWIPGNHEYFHYNIQNGRVGAFEEFIRPNVRVVNNQVIEFDNFRVFPTTLWAEIPSSEQNVPQKVADYRFIQNGDKALDFQTTNLWHEEAKDFLRTRKFFEDQKVSIALTHHVPTLIEYPMHLLAKHNGLGFVTNLDSLIEELAFDYWIFGHHHYNVPAFQKGQTTFLTNQMGYLWKKLDLKFSLEQIISI